MTELSPKTKELIQRYQRWQQSQKPKEGAATIHVDEIASKVAAFYEKLRGIIDWKEEHLLRKRAIERILKRRFFSEVDITNGNVSDQKIARPLVLELIRGGHFPNDRIEEQKIPYVQETINKYIHIINNSSKKNGKEKSKLQLYNWLCSIAACEIEEILTPPSKERALIDFMFQSIKDQIKVSNKVLKREVAEKEKNIQTYIAVQRALFKLDTPVISYHLIKYKYPEWKNLSSEKLNEISKNIYSIWADIENQLNHPLSDKFYKITEKYDTPYLLLGDVLSEEPQEGEKIKNPEKLEGSIRKAYNKRVKTLKSRLGRAATYSTLSIFLTNIISLLAVEIPATKLLTGSFNFWAIGVDIIGPTFLMFLLVMTIKPPKRENLNQVIIEIMKIVYPKKEKEFYEIKPLPKRSFVINFIIRFLYTLGFIIVVGLIIWGLYQVNFPPLSYIIFIIFLSLIAFAGAKIRQRAKELQVIEEKESIIRFFFDPFAVPIVQLGKWLTARWKRYNVIAAFFSALIDMPFTIFIEFIEQWRYFLKERKEKIH